MAASTWFHGSAWPPGNQGTMPLASWILAIVSTVLETSSASRTPGTSGSSMHPLLGWLGRRGVRVRLGCVENDALPEQGVQGLLEQADGLRPGADVPHQEAVVQLRGQGLVVVDPDRALDPPVRGVQRVGVVRTGDLEARPTHTSGELRGLVDADMAAGLVVVVVRQRPADLLGHPTGHGDGDGAAGAQHAD